MLIIIIRTLILYALVIIVMRIMGKRQIGQLQPFELAIAIMISELAAVPMQNTGIPILNGIVPILTLLFSQIILSFISMKNIRARAFICGRPSILIENGKINQHNLRKEMYTINDLLEQLRIKDIANISDVQFAILETNGQLSVFPKPQKQPPTAADMSVKVDDIRAPIDIIIDGNLMEENLNISNHDKPWVLSQLNSKGISSIEDVFIASIDTQGKLYIQEKDEVKKHK